MKYVVTKDFADLKDNGYIYRVGDLYPREGVAVDEGRAKELSSKDNKRGEVLIKARKPKKKTKKEK